MNSAKNNPFRHPIKKGNVIISLIIIIATYFVFSTPILKQAKNSTIETSAFEDQQTVPVEQDEKLSQENVFPETEKQDVFAEEDLILSRSKPLPSATTTETTIQESQKKSSLVDQQNSLLESLSKLAQAGSLKPSKIGITPIFRFSPKAVDKNLQEQTLKNLSKGSYNSKQEIVTFNINEKDSWQSLGSWTISGYNATVAQCDSTPSITASGHIVTPGFTMAIDNTKWKYGTIFYVENVGFAIAADCGGSGVRGTNRGDYLTASKKYAYQITGHHKVWLVYKPQK